MPCRTGLQRITGKKYLLTWGAARAFGRGETARRRNRGSGTEDNRWALRWHTPITIFSKVTPMLGHSSRSTKLPNTSQKMLTEGAVAIPADLNRTEEKA